MLYVDFETEEIYLFLTNSVNGLNAVSGSSECQESCEARPDFLVWDTELAWLANYRKKGNGENKFDIRSFSAWHDFIMNKRLM